MMNAKASSIIFIIFTAISGVGVVTIETPQNFFLFVLWFGATVGVIRRQQKHLRDRRAMEFIHGATMAIIIIAAIFAPVKRIDALMEESVQLDATQMTVAQLSEYCQSHRKSMPLTILIPSGGSAAKSKIHFATDRMPLKEFIDQVKHHTGLNPRFSGCGNAYSVLYGDAYNFGLSFIPDADSEYQWE